MPSVQAPGRESLSPESSGEGAWEPKHRPAHNPISVIKAQRRIVAPSLASDQCLLCDQLRSLSTQKASTQIESQLNSWMASIESELTGSLRRIVAELAVTEGQERHLHRVQKVLLDGSRRTLNILTNAVAMLSITFPPALATAERGSQDYRTAKV
jgi:hypothetical protein